MIEKIDITSVRLPKATLEQWRVLQTVVDAGGFAQAAEKLHRSQSSVSYAVAKLQEQLGIALLEIDGRKAVLTEAGVALLRRSRQLVADALQLEQSAHSLNAGWEAEIQLIVDAAFPTQLLIETLKAFAPLNRGCRIQLVEVVLSGADDALRSGEADLVIGHRVPPGYLADPLIEIEFVAVAHPDNPLHGLGRELTTDDLRRQLQVVVRDSGTTDKQDVGWLGADDRWTVSSTQTSLTTLCSGIGYAWLPRHLVGSRIAAGELKELPLEAGRTRLAKLFLIFGKPGQEGPAARELARLFRQTVADAHGTNIG